MTRVDRSRLHCANRIWFVWFFCDQVMSSDLLGYVEMNLRRDFHVLLCPGLTEQTFVLSVG